MPAGGPVEQAVAERTLAERLAVYAAEARRLIDAAFAVMSRSESLDPPVREIVKEAGLSNQAFYRHFASKDALLLAALADGRRRLVAYLQHRVDSTPDPRLQIERWIDGVMAQARDRDAAAATRPFSCHADRLAARFPGEVAASKAELIETLRPAVVAAGGRAGDAQLVHDLVMSRMHDALANRRHPDREEVHELVAFCLAAVTRGT
jgi:AcrR family transcriptional regulator